MHAAREFFDMLLSPFILQPILSFTFSSNQLITQFCAATQVASKQGCQFLTVLFHNMFIAEPHDAVQDVMEANFGFQLTQIAGVSVDQFKKDKEIGAPGDGSSETENKEGEEPNAKAEESKEGTQSEFTAMKQEELAKERLLAGATRIYELQEVNPLLAQQIVTQLQRYEQLFVP